MPSLALVEFDGLPMHERVSSALGALGAVLAAAGHRAVPRDAVALWV
jgi:hypothetical protein